MATYSIKPDYSFKKPSLSVQLQKINDELSLLSEIYKKDYKKMDVERIAFIYLKRDRCLIIKEAITFKIDFIKSHFSDN